MSWAIKTRAIAVDLDGTLCDTTGGKQFLETKKNYDAFHEYATTEAPPNVAVAKVIDIFQILQYDTLFITGRHEKWRRGTEDWLINNNIYFNPDLLFMRADDDYRKDSVVKKEIYHRDIEPYWKILFVMDDRNQVVDMWRELGLTCFQVAPGDF
jgi:phosphoglycolate phosphatase-like HAD superfamily hydrolase